MSGTSCMTNWRKDDPDWLDDGLIKLLTAGGCVVRAQLNIWDAFSKQEKPVAWDVTLENGRPVQLHDYKGWRPLTPTGSEC